ncbi:MAG: M1 family metallopeptidase [Clostridia bacterium]|nr:M1 family metallopeptidase [Clostridia bacterium]
MKQKLPPALNRKAWLYAWLIVLMMFLVGAGSILLMNCWPRQVQLPGVSPELTATARGLDDICIDADFDPDSQRLTFTQTLKVTNRTGQDQSAVVLRSWSGAYLLEETSPCTSDELYSDCYPGGFSSGGLAVDSAEVNGVSVTPAFTDDASTVLRIPADWPVNDTVTVTLRCTVAIPDCAGRFGHADGIYMLGNVFPVPAVWQDGAWRTDAYVSVGDPFLSECANWHVTLRAPKSCTVAASAADVSDRKGVHVYEGLALRDFALVIGQDLTAVQAMAEGVLITACARDKTDAEAMLLYATRAMQTYARRWGAYPYPTFTLAEAVFPYGGMEYPGLVMIGDDVLHSAPQVLEYTVAHETAHQWWAVTVGSDGFYQAWQDEALCEYAWLDYVGDWEGAADREQMAFDRIETALRITIPGGVTPGSPIDYFSDLTQYSRVVYQRGAALWCALEIHLGKDGLDALLRDYYDQYAFRIATREELTALISRHAGMDMSALLLDYLDTLMY